MKKVTLFLFILNGLCHAAFDDAPVMDADQMGEEIDQKMMEAPPQFDDSIDTDQQEDESGLSAGAIAGITAGVVGGVAALGGAALGAKKVYDRSGSTPAQSFEVSTPATGKMAHQDTTADILKEAKTPEELRQVQARLEDSARALDEDLQKARNNVLAERDANGDSPDIQRRLANLDAAEQENEIKKAKIQDDIEKIKSMVAERTTTEKPTAVAVDTQPQRPALVTEKPSLYQRATGRAAAAKAVAPGGEVYAINQRVQAEQDVQRQLIAEQAQDRKQVGALAQRLQAQQERIAQIENQREFVQDAAERAVLDDRRAAALAERDALQEQQKRAKQAFIQKWTAPQPRIVPASAQEPKLPGTNQDRLEKDRLRLKQYADDANSAQRAQQARQSQFDSPVIPKRRR